MDYKVNLQVTKEYFNESFDQLVRYGSRWRKVEYVVGACFILLGAGLVLYCKGQTLTPFVLVVVGLYELFGPYVKKVFWVIEQTRSKMAEQEIELRVNDEGIFSRGKYGTSSTTWQGIEKIIETPKGVLIWPQKRVCTYLPKRVLDPDVLRYIVSKSAGRPSSLRK